MKEPIEYFFKKKGFDRKHISKWVIGEKYVGLMNSDGHIGVCATLGTEMNDGLFLSDEPDISDPVHRIILNAWFNSIYNYMQSYDHVTDIFDGIDFRTRGKIVMVGFFESLYEKFVRESIDLEVFDIQKESPVLTDIKGFDKAVSHCDTLILTGTTIFNRSFTDVLSKTNESCSVFLLGPSNILSPEMFEYRNIKVVFGSVFKKNDTRVFNKIKEGRGTRGFLEYLDKVYISNEDKT